MLSRCVYKSHCWEYDRPDLHGATLAGVLNWRSRIFFYVTDIAYNKILITEKYTNI
jgi:hypothetical protein